MAPCVTLTKPGDARERPLSRGQWRTTIEPRSPKGDALARKLMRGLVYATGALGLIGFAVPRYLWFRRREFPSRWRLGALATRDVATLALAHLANGHDRLVVVAHGLMTTMRAPGIMQMAEALGERFDVLSFDLPGHGQSSGEMRVDCQQAAKAVAHVVAHGRALGYEHIGVLGYSLGAAGAIIAAAQGAPVSAVASISSPAGPPGDGRLLVRALPALRGWMRLMGTRVAPVVNGARWPIEYVRDVSPVPLFIVHCGLDNLVSRADSESLFAAASMPKDYSYVPTALHAAPLAAREEVIAWLDAHVPREAAGSRKASLARS